MRSGELAVDGADVDPFSALTAPPPPVGDSDADGDGDGDGSLNGDGDGSGADRAPRRRVKPRSSPNAAIHTMLIFFLRAGMGSPIQAPYRR